MAGLLLAALGVSVNAQGVAVFDDFDGDFKSDPTVYYAPGGLWYSKLSNSGATSSAPPPPLASWSPA